VKGSLGVKTRMMEKEKLNIGCKKSEKEHKHEI